jgi:hypothetical protein
MGLDMHQYSQLALSVTAAARYTICHQKRPVRLSKETPPTACFSPSSSSSVPFAIVAPTYTPTNENAKQPMQLARPSTINPD